MKLLGILLLLITHGHEVLSGHASIQTIPESMKFILYNDTSLLELFVQRDGITWSLDHLQIDASKGLQVDPVTEAVLWIEDGVLMRGSLRNMSTSKIWIPQRLGQTFHYDWHKRWLYCFSEDDQSENKLKIIDLNVREVYENRTSDSGTLKAIDSSNGLFIHKTDDSLKMYTMNNFEEKHSIQISDNFELMDIFPNNRILIVSQSPQKHQKDEDKNIIKLYDYEGEELHSVPVDVEYDSVFFQEPLLIMKYKAEITVLDIKSKDVFYKLYIKEFTNMTLKHFKHIDETEVPAQSTYESMLKCKKTDYEEVCISDEDSEDEGGRCVYQSYIISNGTSFKHFNPAYKSPPIPLPFEVTGSIRNFDLYKRERIFWINGQTNSIVMNYIYLDTKPEVLDFTTVSPTDLKVDEDRKFLFWADEGKRTIEVSDFDGLVHKELFTGVRMPRKLLLALDYGSIIWLEGRNNDTIVIGSIEEGSKKVLFQSEEPVFGFAIDYIYNILYVGSQSDHLLIHAVNLNLGVNRRVFKSKVSPRFLDVLYSRNNIYLQELETFWKFNPSNQKLHAVSGEAFNSVFVSPTICRNSQSREKSCGQCNGICLSSTQGSTSVMKNTNCVPLDLTTKGYSTCDFKKYLFVSTKHSVFRLYDEKHCYSQLFGSEENTITAEQPVAFNSVSKILYIAAGNYIYYTNFLDASLSGKKHFGDNINEAVFIGYVNEPIVKSQNSWKTWDGLSLSNTEDDYDDYANDYRAITLSDESVSAIAYPSQNVFFYIKDDYIYCHDKFSYNTKKIFPVPSHVKVIRISYEENRIYYRDTRTFHSVRLDGEKHRYFKFDVPPIKTFALWNKVLYYVSEEDSRLYEIHYTLKNSTSYIKLSKIQPEGIINLINFQPVNDKINACSEQLKDDDGECFKIF